MQSYLTGLKLERGIIQRIRLTVEELLLNIMKGCGKGIRLSQGIGKRFGRHLQCLRYISFTTASSLSSMALNMDTCEKKFGTQDIMVSFLFPLDSMFSDWDT